MALVTVKTQAELGVDLVLAPERYDPRRESLNGDQNAVPLSSVAETVRHTVSPSKNGGARCLVLDTSDVREGVVVEQKEAVSGSDIGSAKKVVRAGDVIISRLRPYLRQVGLVDAELWNVEAGVQLTCSTEFHVLRSLGGESIAFLVPFLLSRPVQDVLSASQEGGHHPRFNESTLLNLPIPKRVLDGRVETSRAIEECVKQYRRCEGGIAACVRSAEKCFSNKAKRRKSGG